MLPQKHRITAKEFDFLLKNSTRLFTQHLNVAFIESKSDFKASVVATKKIYKKAVDRNRQKRRVREAVREVFLSEGAKNHLPFSCIFFIKSDIANVELGELVAELTILSKKLK
jgi:ribonuclease P protein component